MIRDWKWMSDWHEPIQQALIQYRGTILTASQVKNVIRSVPGIGSRANFIHASDHCLNMDNVGACDCAKTKRSLLKRIRRGHYLVR